MRTTILFLSVVGNVTLLAIVLAGAIVNPPSPAAGDEVLSTSSGQAKVSPPVVADSATWGSLSEGDLPRQIARLRAEGFPPEMIRAIVAAQVHESFAARRQAIEAGSPGAVYWRPLAADPRREAQQALLAREEADRLDELLGPDPETSRAATMRRRLPGFPDDKITQIAEIQARYQQREMEFRVAQARNPTGQESQGFIDQMDRELAAALSPEQFEDYQLRVGPTASSLRSQLQAFDATEQEFRALYRLEAAYADRVRMRYDDVRSPEQTKTMMAARQELDQEVKTLLGDARYAEYVRAKDNDYRETRKVVARFQLPPEVANQVYNLRKDITARAGPANPELRTLPAEERNLRIQNMTTEARRQLTALLGPEGYQVYTENRGDWIGNIEARLTPPVKQAP